jgi:Flp pilus assembly protein TadD
MPSPPDALAIAVKYHQAGNLQAAEQTYREILALDPNHADALHLLGVVAFQSGDLDRAVQCISAAIQLNGTVAKFHSNLGNVFQAQRKLDEAVQSFRRALELDPQFAEAYLNLGSAFETQGRLDEAVEAYRQTLNLKPHQPEAFTNLGLALLAQGNIDAAAASFDSALQQNPNYADAHGNRALLRLLQGDFHCGWSQYEWRWRSNQIERRDFAQPRWDGSPLRDRTILLHAEQGLGDTIQFIRYAAEVKKRNPHATVIVECQRPLTKILMRCAGVDQLVPAGDPLTLFHVQSPLLSLPGIFQTTLNSIPANVPYLLAEPKLVEHWRKWLESVEGLRIGINWQGRSGEGEFRKRNIPLEYFTALAQLPGVQLISLQKQDDGETIAASSRFPPMLEPGPDFDTVHGAFEDTAAIMMNPDLIITSDTSVPHLAGALGVPVWVALPFVPDWRWMLQRTDSPWYPTMRLFRQKSQGDWSGVFNEIFALLKQIAPGTQ